MIDEEPALERLEHMGFRNVGSWGVEGGKTKYTLNSTASARNILYAFVVNGEVMYIGKSRRMLKERMYNYQNPGPSQSTNVKANALITEALGEGKQVDIYALPDNGLLHYGGFHVNLAAGLEDDLVGTLRPAWNKSGV